METFLVICNFCRLRNWVPIEAKTFRCVCCKQVNSAPGSSELPRRVFLIKNNNNFSTTAQMKESPSRSLVLSRSRPLRKRALLCGVSYNHRWKLKLSGTISDVKNMKELLITNFNFPVECIRQLTEKDPELVPTKENIKKALQWLVEGCRSGDSLVFYFSGHGTKMKDIDGDEVDGYDESICPVDFEKQGPIVDDDIYSTIVRPLPPGVTLHAIIDSCYSGTMLDLPFVFDAKQKNWVHGNPPGVQRGTSGGVAICISACRDEQKALDSSVLSGKTALTSNLIQEIKKNPRLTYGGLVTRINKNIDEAIQTAPGFRFFVQRKFFPSSLLQEIQLSSSDKFDVYREELKF